MSNNAANDPKPLEPNESNRNREFRIRKAALEDQLASVRETILAANEERVFIEAQLEMLYKDFGRGRLNNSVSNGVHFPLLGGKKNRKTRRGRR